MPESPKSINDLFLEEIQNPYDPSFAGVQIFDVSTGNAPQGHQDISQGGAHIGAYVVNPTFGSGFVDVVTGAQWRGLSLSVDSLRQQISFLAANVEELKQEIVCLRSARTFVVPLISLAPYSFELTQQIPVTIDGDGEDFTATFMEANISASGETEADALANLKDILAMTYEILEKRPAKELGRIPSRQWEILKSVMKKTR